MSRFVMLPAAACFDPRVIPQMLRTLAIISSHASRDRVSWCSYKTLAYEVGISRRLIIGYINKLCEFGYISKEARQRDDGSQTSNKLTLNFSIELEVDDTRGSEAGHHYPPPSQDHGGSEAGHHGAMKPGITEKEQEPINYNQGTIENKSIKKSSKKQPDLLTLDAWEKKVGSELKPEMMKSWLLEKGIAKPIAVKLIIDFRGRMTARGNLFADFRAAFQNWLNRGFLCMSVEQAKAASSTIGRSVHEHQGGPLTI